MNDYITVNRRIDFALEETIIKYPDFINKFSEYFIKNGFNPSLITRTNGARNLVDDLKTSDVLIEIFKHINHCKVRVLDMRINRSLVDKYPFLRLDALNPIEYASISEKHLKELIDFFIKTRYSMTVYNKSCVDTMEIILQCRDLDRNTEEYFNSQKHKMR